MGSTGSHRSDGDGKWQLALEGADDRALSASAGGAVRFSGYLVRDHEGVYHPKQVSPMVEVRCDDMLELECPPTWWSHSGARIVGEDASHHGWMRNQRMSIVGNLERNYVPLRRVFQYYCVNGLPMGRQDPFTMGLRQFHNFAKDARLRVSHRDVDAAFELTKAELEDDGTGDECTMTLTLDEFLEALVRLAHARHCAGSRAHAAMQTLGEALGQVLQVVLRNANQLLPEDDFDAEWNACKTTVFKKWAKPVGRIFRAFPKRSQAPPEKNDYMLCDEWMAFLGKHRMISSRLTASRALAVFLLTNNLHLGLSPTLDREAIEEDETKLDEGEFLEALCRVAREHALSRQHLRGVPLERALGALLTEAGRTDFFTG